jgi:hypothetical protein
MIKILNKSWDYNIAAFSFSHHWKKQKCAVHRNNRKALLLLKILRGITLKFVLNIGLKPPFCYFSSS